MALVNETVTYTDSSSGFYFWYSPGRGPTNWLAPDDYYNGQVYCRFEVLAQPTSSPSYLSFCIWGNPETPGTSPETASPLSPVLAGSGSVVTFSSTPATWWKQDGGINFSNRSTFYRWGLPHWGSNTPPILLAPQGYSTDPRSWTLWEQRTNWLPFTVKATVVAVSQGSTFSGWNTYLETQPPSVPAYLAVVGATSNSISLNWSASTDNVAVVGYSVYRNGTAVGTNAATSWTDTGLTASTTNTYIVRAFDAAGNLSAASATVIGKTTAVGLGAAPVRFTHFTIQNPLPGTAYGTAGIPLADFDGDGDLDCALSRRDAHGFWWYERKTDSEWVQHLLSDSPSLAQGLGCAALDVDNDGWTDLVFDTVWFKNPGTLTTNRDAVWTTNAFGGAGHDIVAADINRDGRNDIVVFDGNTLCWFNPAAGMASNVVALSLGHHGGVAPKGVGDIDGDGDPDLVVAGAWFENPGNGVGTWVRHTWPYVAIPNASYGTSIRSWVVDLDGDGDQDIVYSDCDTGYSHVYWVRNEGHGTNWTRFALPDPPTSPGSVLGTGSFHSLGVADFNLDGKLDIFAGEQEDPDQMSGGKLPMKPPGLKERGVVWVNSGSSPPTFTPQVIQEDNPGWHDTCLGDVDGDGDIDMVTKVWNKDGVAYHADYWRNDAIVRLDNGIDLSGWHTNGGLWQVTNGMIVGQQNPPGSGNGGLLFSDGIYGDFEATFEVWPDWGVDTGFYTRATANEKAYQVTIDYQPNNPMGGIYLAGISDSGAWDFTIAGTNSIQGNPQYFTLEDWPNIWNPTGWNTFRVVISNNPPHIVTWINGTKIEDYQDTVVRLAASGMVALQVHPTAAEWPLGAVTRFRNIRIRDLAYSGSLLDTQPPTAPGNLLVTGVAGTSISLNWNASADNVGVTGYRIYRNGIEVATSPIPEFTDAGLFTNTPYAYAVRAFDASGNQSALSAIVATNTVAGSGSGAVPTLGLAFRVRADSGVTLNGSAVSQWNDLSGNGRNASQTASASQPLLVANVLNGKPVLRFDGVNDYLNFNLPINGCTGLTMVLVTANSASRDPGANQGNCAPLFWEETASWGWTYLSPFQTNVVMRFGTTQSANLFKYTRPATIVANFSITVGIHNGTTDSLYVNGNGVMSASGKLAPIAGTVSTPYLGRGASSTYFPGDIAEVLVYTRALSGAERIDVENYLRARYLPSQFPSIQITSPTNSYAVVGPTNITIAASAASSVGTIASVDFFVDGGFIGQKMAPPYTVVWSNAAPGSYALTARANDSVGGARVSDAVLVQVTSPPTVDLPPVLSPIADQTIVAGALLAITNHAYDPNTPAQQLQFNLIHAPAGASIDENTGMLSWRPTLAQSGPSNLFTVVTRQPGLWQTNLTPSDDAHVIEAYPSANYGSQSALMVKASTTTGLTRESFLRFNLPAVARPLDMASLHLMPTSASIPGTHAAALVNDSAWTESSLTWSSKPASTTILATWVPQAGVAVDVPITAGAQNGLQSGKLALRLYATNTTADGLVYYGSKEGASGDAPWLHLEMAGPSLSATQSFWVSVVPPVRPQLQSVRVLANGAAAFSIVGDAGPDYILQASSNLVDWVPVLTTNSPALPLVLSDPDATKHQTRFYRVLCGP